MLPDEDGHSYHNDEELKHSADFLMETLPEINPASFALRKYKEFDQPSKVFKTAVVASCIHRLLPFDTKEALNYFSRDELGLDSFGAGDDKTALFISGGKSNDFDFIVPLMYTQLFDLLCGKNAKQ
jgi:hypothetical protein